MASLNYLWKNRAHFDLKSKMYYRAWAKRVLSLPELTQRNLCRIKLTNGGASINETAEINNSKLITGKLSFLKIGASTFIGKVSIALHDDVIIGDRVCINDDVEILTASHDVLDPEWKHIKGKITIGDYAWIGTGATLLPGVSIGRGAVVGAKAVVSRSVLPGQIVVGNPAKPVAKVRPYELNYNPCEFLAANRAWLIG